MKIFSSVARAAMMFALCLPVLACGTDTNHAPADEHDHSSHMHEDSTPAAASFELVGHWTSSWGAESITSDASSTTTTWSDYGAAQVVWFDNAANVAVTQNAADDAYNPSKFSRRVWTEISGDAFYYCIIDFGKNTLEEARDATTAYDASTPDTGGCGAFPWTKLTKMTMAAE